MNRVLKFGGAAVARPESFQKIAAIIAARHQVGERLIVVVSAMRNMTDRLHRLALQVHPEPPAREQDMLVSVGERISIALLAMALDRLQIPAISFTGSQSGILTSSDHLDARILEVRPTRIREALQSGQVAIVAGYQGVSRERNITTLGRGGSDISAVALAVATGADRVEFFKDVNGICTADPRTDSEARLLPELGYREALQLMENNPRPVLHPRSIRLAEANQLPLVVRPFAQLEKEGSVVSDPTAKRSRETFFETACH